MMRINKNIKSDNFNEFELLDTIIIAIIVMLGISLARDISDGKIRFWWNCETNERVKRVEER